jgi:hypothetical protein
MYGARRPGPATGARASVPARDEEPRGRRRRTAYPSGFLNPVWEAA